MNQIVADESVDFRIIKELRKLGVKVLSVLEEMPSIEDKDVLDMAVKNDAILLTEDKDFGELIFRFRFPHRGILLIRSGNNKNTISMVANAIVNHSQELYGKFSVIDDNRLRIKE